jgi:hypothetical protein
MYIVDGLGITCKKEETKKLKDENARLKAGNP